LHDILAAGRALARSYDALTDLEVSMFSAPHRRLNCLTGEWVLVSPHRTARPWQGQVEAHATERRPSHDPACYLCPGNERAGGTRTPDYSTTFVFDNDFAALNPDTTPERSDRAGLLIDDMHRARLS